MARLPSFTELELNIVMLALNRLLRDQALGALAHDAELVRQILPSLRNAVAEAALAAQRSYP
jgi:hypothetical protein